ncbi:PH domain-containing protein [Streptomyces sp. NPDC059278]|uniref:PH domain-containing protein n=1 Tax=Streptomyces sp. NPDC059278 TaxID=3346801 RepID=UPI0036821AD4
MTRPVERLETPGGATAVHMMALCCRPGQFIWDVQPLVLRYPALRIDPAGISKVRRVGSATVQWGDIDQVRFNSRQSLLLLVLKEGALPEKPIAVGGRRAVVLYSLGNSLWRRRRPNHPALIVEAVERFAPGKYTDLPWNLGAGGAKGAGASA